MFQHQPQGRGRLSAGRLFVRIVAPAACSLTILSLAAAPSSARQEAGDLSARQASIGQCGLQRVGTQFVSCDFLTGNGVPAPGWVPKR